MQLPSISDVRAAAFRIGDLAVKTPLLRAPVLDERIDGTVFLKAESLQRVGAFKFRGALNAIRQIDRDAFPGGVVACSSGNHAQGVACAASLVGLPAVIVMPRDAPALKRRRTAAYGAEVVLYDREREDRLEIAMGIARERRAEFVHPYDDARVISGQGTVGLELMEQVTAAGAVLDAVLVPCSGGGLSSGVSLAVKAVSNATAVHTVEPAGFDDFARSLEGGKRVRNDRVSGSICDALMAETPGDRTFAIGQENFANGLVVADDEVREAVRFAFEELKLVLEPGGAAALAAVLNGKLPVRRRVIACVLSGGNVDPADFANLIAA